MTKIIQIFKFPNFLFFIFLLIFFACSSTKYKIFESNEQENYLTQIDSTTKIGSSKTNTQLFEQYLSKSLEIKIKDNKLIIKGNGIIKTKEKASNKNIEYKRLDSITDTNISKFTEDVLNQTKTTSKQVNRSNNGFILSLIGAIIIGLVLFISTKLKLKK